MGLQPLFGPPCVCGHIYSAHDEPSDEYIGPCMFPDCSCMVYFPADE